MRPPTLSRQVACPTSRTGQELQVPRTRQPFRRQHIVPRAAATSQAETQQEYFAQDKRPIILFDGVCNICNGGVNFALDLDSHKSFRFAPLQSAAGRALLQRCGRQPDDISSIVLVEEDRCSIKSEAILQIGQRLDAPWAQLATAGFIVPLALRDVLYDQVANNRYSVFGKRKDCRACDQKLKGAEFLS